MTLVAFAVCWLAAIAGVQLWGFPWWLTGLTVAAAAPIAAWRQQRRLTVCIAIAALLALTGAWRFQQWQSQSAPSLAAFVGSEVTLDGRVDSEPDPGESWTSYLVAIDRAQTTDGGYADVLGRVRITVGQYDEHIPGERVRLKGALREAPVYPDFDYRSYLARRGVVGTMSNPTVERLEAAPRFDTLATTTRIRLALDHSLQRSLPEPEAALGAGIAFGRDGDLPDALYNDFRTTGLAHIVAVSGSNVSLVAALTFLVFVRLIGRRFAIWPAALTVVGYLFIAGLSASVIRAGIMATVFLLGQFLGRQKSALAALGLAVIAMTFVQPAAAVDLGFQLSLAATAGLIAFGPWISYGLDRAIRRGSVGQLIPGASLQVAALSLSATIATLPITWVNFGTVSLIGPVANIVIEPLFVFAFWLSGVAAVAGALWAPAGWFVGLAAYYPLAFITSFTRAAADIPGAAIDVPTLNGTVAAAAFVLLGAGGWFAYNRLVPVAQSTIEEHRGQKRVRRLALVGVGAACLVAIVPVSILSGRSDGNLRMTVLDAGDGDAILFQTPHGRLVLVNAGPSGVATARELGAVLPHWRRDIDALILTQPQNEHAGGAAELIERFDIGTEMDAGLPGGTDGFAAYAARVANRGPLNASGRYTIDGVVFEPLWPPAGFDAKQSNDEALVLLVTFGQTRFLLPSNLSATSQAAILAGARADVLLVPHHGANVTDEPLLDAVAPAIAIIPLGSDRFAQRPKGEVLGHLAGASIWRTDRNGRVTVSSDGSRLVVDAAH